MTMSNQGCHSPVARSNAGSVVGFPLIGRMKTSDKQGVLHVLLMGSVCAMCLVAGLTSKALADQTCTPTGDTLACSGDLSSGLLVDPVYTGLTIDNVTSDVGSVGGVVGLRFDNDGDVTVTSNTGDFAIVGHGTGLSAIHLSSFGDDYGVSLTQTGNVTSDDGSAVLATSWGNVSVAVTGGVSGKQTAIQAQSLVGGGVTVVQKGDVISYEGSAIYATAPGAVSVTANGAVTSKQDAIYANNFGTDAGATVSVTTTGTIESWGGVGINASSAKNSVLVDSGSSITAKQGGVHANSSGDANGGSVIVRQHGAITTSDGAGIYALST